VTRPGPWEVHPVFYQAASTRRQHVGPSRGQSQLPVWLSEHRAYPRERAQSLREQIHPPVCWVLCLRLCLSPHVRGFLILYFRPTQNKFALTILAFMCLKFFTWSWFRSRTRKFQYDRLLAVVFPLAALICKLSWSATTV